MLICFFRLAQVFPGRLINMALTMEEEKSARRNLKYLAMCRHPSFNRAEIKTRAEVYWLLYERYASGTLPKEVMQRIVAGADPQPERAAAAVAAPSPNDGGDGDESADESGPVSYTHLTLPTKRIV